jgi:hypothetical protein
MSTSNNSGKVVEEADIKITAEKGFPPPRPRNTRRKDAWKLFSSFVPQTTGKIGEEAVRTVEN